MINTPQYSINGDVYTLSKPLFYINATSDLNLSNYLVNANGFKESFFGKVQIDASQACTVMIFQNSTLKLRKVLAANESYKTCDMLFTSVVYIMNTSTEKPLFRFSGITVSYPNNVISPIPELTTISFTTSYQLVNSGSFSLFTWNTSNNRKGALSLDAVPALINGDNVAIFDSQPILDTGIEYAIYDGSTKLIQFPVTLPYHEVVYTP